MLFNIVIASTSLTQSDPVYDLIITDIQGLNTTIKLISKVASYEIQSVSVLSDTDRNRYIEGLQPDYASA